MDCPPRFEPSAGRDRTPFPIGEAWPPVEPGGIIVNDTRLRSMSIACTQTLTMSPTRPDRADRG